MVVLSGAGDILFGTAPGPLPDFWNFAPRYVRAVLNSVMPGLLALHVGSALYHLLILKDRLLARMGLGQMIA